MIVTLTTWTLVLFNGVLVLWLLAMLIGVIYLLIYKG